MANDKPNMNDEIKLMIIALVAVLSYCVLIVTLVGCMSAELEEALASAEQAQAEAAEIREEEARARQDAISQLDEAIIQSRSLANQIGALEGDEAIAIAIDAAGLVASLEQIRADIVAQDQWSREAWTQQQTSIQTLMESLNQLIVRAKTFEGLGGLLGTPTLNPTSPDVPRDSGGGSVTTIAGIGTGLLGLGGLYLGGRRITRGVSTVFRDQIIPRLPAPRRRAEDMEEPTNERASTSAAPNA